jgi:leucyl-tRNA synthetase
MSERQASDKDVPPNRYDARLANEIEAKWQDRWEADRTFWTPNPAGLLADVNAELAAREPLYILDMFPYPSGAGLHVGHPLGYIGTDVYARFMRMEGYNVLHAMGYDAFGLPAEQYAVQTGQHPRVTTEANIATMRRQLRALGLAHDPRRGIATTDVAYYRWTQWIFLKIYNSWYDRSLDRARPIDELVAELEAGTRLVETGELWSDMRDADRRAYVDSMRLAYLDEQDVNWCPELGTVLANEEVTSEGRSDRGNHPVYRRPLKQWMLRITSYADRLIADLDRLDWSDSIKTMQRNWIGRSEGASIRFPVEGHDGVDVEVFTTRPDTLFGATYMVLAPEHPLVDVITANEWPDDTIGEEWSTSAPATWRGVFGATGTPAEAVARYREFAAQKSELERQSEGREKTGAFIGAFCVNPANDARIPVFIADYVLMGYGTGAIMAVPGQDERDWEFAEEFELPIVRTVQPPADWEGKAYLGDGPAISSGFLDGLGVDDAKARIVEWLEETGYGEGTVTYKLRDWLFSRQRYWGEPFPIVYDDQDLPVALPEEMLPVVLPEVDDFEPSISDDPDSIPEPPLSRAEGWVEVELELPGPAWAGGGGGRRVFRRETNTMPQWAGSCWYYLRYLDPTNEDRLVDLPVEAYWSGTDRDPDSVGTVTLYVGGVEHAVLHLLYARFWHKVLFDLGFVTTPEPFARLFNQGYILAAAYTDDRGRYVEAADVEERADGFFFGGARVTREFGKMGKSLKNAVAPDDIYRDYGADTLRLYEMSTGPLEASRPWNTHDIVGAHRFLQRLWRIVVDEDSGELHVDDGEVDDDTSRVLHRTIAAVRADMSELGFNTAIARLFELNNHLTQLVAERGSAPRAVVEPLVLMVAPLAPHIAEELWERLGHDGSLAYEPFPRADERFLVVDSVEIAVQIEGKVRSRITVPTDADDAAVEAAARSDRRIAELLDGVDVRKVVVVPRRLVNFVL